MSTAIDSLKDRLGRIPGVAVLIRAIEKSNDDHAKDMAASIAYFSFFSLFPLLVGVVAGASLFMDRDKIESRLNRMLSDEFPGTADFLRANIEALIARWSRRELRVHLCDDLARLCSRPIQASPLAGPSSRSSSRRVAVRRGAHRRTRRSPHSGLGSGQATDGCVKGARDASLVADAG